MFVPVIIQRHCFLILSLISAAFDEKTGFFLKQHNTGLFPQWFPGGNLNPFQGTGKPCVQSHLMHFQEGRGICSLHCRWGCICPSPRLITFGFGPCSQQSIWEQRLCQVAGVIMTATSLNILDSGWPRTLKKARKGRTQDRLWNIFTVLCPHPYVALKPVL